ncbi:hypothetical protein CPB83DRAFT_852309 [Crepidotus variabilis]|uniref:Uncharacterized protein n=1 Tax=Crepidotus variabilis TaxID=179855 RepID=A0A9P6EIG4_9AGAR|nr:hypothetical protein CPB83DRAFT_852309 [Crepidotus variabilis]
MRAKLDVKYKQSATPLETDLDSDKLETTSSSYEAKKEGATMPSRDTFSFSFRGPDLQSNGHEGTEKAKQTKSTPNATPPSRDPASLKNISNPHVRTILDKMMKEDGFAYKAWDGGTSHPVLDSLKRVAVVLVGKINQESYQNATKEVFEGMEACGASAYFSDSESKHKRGKFPAVNVGISLGPGGTKPMRVSVGGHGPMMQRLIDNKHVQRLASHQDASFKFWQPKLYKHYSDMMVKLRGRNPTLRKNFPRSVFASMAFNFPPHVYTHRHRDVRNLPYGMCAVHALGNFDPTAGGHLILWELKLIIEFPPGCMVLLPSATITHSNVPVAVGQKRASITQYTAGSLFRHVDNGFTTDAALKASNKARFEVHSAARLCRWEKGLNMWSKYVDGKII